MNFPSSIDIFEVKEVNQSSPLLLLSLNLGKTSKKNDKENDIGHFFVRPPTLRT